MADDRVVSAPKEQRAAELVAFLTDPDVAAVIPPWGGETAIDLLDQLDWDALAAAEPTWLVGWSDISPLLLPLTAAARAGRPCTAGTSRTRRTPRPTGSCTGSTWPRRPAR